MARKAKRNLRHSRRLRSDDALRSIAAGSVLRIATLHTDGRSKVHRGYAFAFLHERWARRQRFCPLPEADRPYTANTPLSRPWLNVVVSTAPKCASFTAAHPLNASVASQESESQNVISGAR